MTERDLAISITELLASASKILEDNGYRRAEQKLTSDWQVTNARLFEDDYSIVALIVYDTWDNLSANWVDAQASLVELMSKYVTSLDAKSWDGYLILLTPNPVPKESGSEMIKIRYDTTRVRKLIGTGDDIKVTADVKNILLPLLPLPFERADEYRESVLELLPRLLSGRGISEEAVRLVVSAFLEQRPIIESLHRYRSSNESN